MNAQNSISGIIRDQDSIPLPGATIYIPDLNKGTATNNDGEYRITNLPNGKISIQYSYIGYINQVVTAEVNNENKLLNINKRG